MTINELEKEGIFKVLSYDAAKAAIFLLQKHFEMSIDMDDRNILIMKTAKEINWYFCERHLRDTYDLLPHKELPEDCI